MIFFGKKFFSIFISLFIFFMLFFSLRIFAQYSKLPELIPYRQGKKWGYCDRNKNIVIECKYDEAKRFVGSYAEVTLKEIKLYLNSKGEIVKKPEELIEKTKTEGDQINYEVYEENGLYGFKDKNGNIIIKPIFEKAFRFSEGLAPVRKNKKWGYINNKGEVVIPFKYDMAALFKDGLALVRFDGEEGFIDMNGTEYWEDINYNPPKNKWLRKDVTLTYEIDYIQPFYIEIYEISNQIRYRWNKEIVRGFEVLISPKGLTEAYKHLNYIYSSSNINIMKLNDDEISIFCSQKMFDEMKKNNKVTFYPYYRSGDKSSQPVTFNFKKKKIVGVNYNFGGNYNFFQIGLECLEFEADSGEKLVVLDNKDYPLIVQMKLDFTIYLKKIENDF
ncbi:MAG: WG repeat-containing protein [Brevinematales bacterium]|nr:WG repeat-containing protein [Brevinematales bacterium]